MATCIFKTNPTILLSYFKYFSARDLNMSSLRESMDRFKEITVIHNEWNEKVLAGVLFLGQGDNNFNQILK